MLIRALLLSILFILLRPSWGAFGFEVPTEPFATSRLAKEASSQEETTIKAIIWNTYKFSNDSIKSDYQKLILNQKPNLLILQESVIPSGESYCLIESDCYFSTAFHRGETHYGVMTSSLFPMQENNTLHSDLTEPILGTPKTSLVSILNLGNEDLLVINTHGINFVSLMAYDTQLREIVEKAKKWTGALIWAGDFNSWNPGRAHLLAQATQALGLKEVQWEDDHLIKRFLGYKLDHVFYKGIDIKKAQVLKTKGSDHNALYFEADLKSRP